MVCPKCHSQKMRRTRRVGLLQTKLLPLFGFFPWFCFHCKTARWLRRRTERVSVRRPVMDYQDAAGSAQSQLPE